MINLETEIREQPRTIPNAIDLNLETIREIVKKAKDKGVKHIYFAALAEPPTMPAYMHSTSSEFSQAYLALSELRLYLLNTARTLTSAIIL